MSANNKNNNFLMSNENINTMNINNRIYKINHRAFNVKSLNRSFQSIRKAMKKAIKHQPQNQNYTVTGSYIEKCINKKNNKKFNRKVTFSQVINAKNIDPLKIKSHVKKMIKEEHLDGYDDAGPDDSFIQSGKAKKLEVTVSKTDDVVSNYNVVSKVPLKSATYCTYHNIKNNDNITGNNGECVYDAILNIYGISKEVQFKIYNSVFQSNKEIMYGNDDEYDMDIETDSDDDEDIFYKNEFNYKSGVTCEMIKKLCETFNIACIGLDLNEKVIIRTFRKSNNYETLVFYIVNEHMYVITDKKEKINIVNRHLNKKCVTSSIFLDETETVSNANLKFSENKIIENIPVNDLIKYSDVNIIYNVSDLKCIFIDIVKKYNHIPKTRENGSNHIIHITLNKGPFLDKNLDLFIDPNITFKFYDWITVRDFCNKVKHPFTNQSVGALSLELFDKVNGNHKNKRVRISKEILELILMEQENKCKLCKNEISKKMYEIDHIMPLALGGDNDRDNLQVLCKLCHYQKTATEQEITNYINVDPTSNNYNSITREIFESNLMKKWSFVERLGQCPESVQLYSIDINKCRKNILLYSKYDIPIYTVLDKPTVYKNEKIEPGFYFIESNNYFPLRGNGWYTQPLIIYCIEQKIIKESDIKYVLKPSLTIPANYFQNYINLVYNQYGNDADTNTLCKMLINSFIGTTYINENVITTNLYTTNIKDAAYLSVKKDMVPFLLDEKSKIFQCTNKKTIKKSDDRKSIYLQILDIETIELHKLCKLVEKNNGIVYEINTDCVTFSATQKPNINNIYWDDEKTQLKYKYETVHQIKSERKPRYIRDAKYDIPYMEWNNLHTGNELAKKVYSIISPIVKRGDNYDELNLIRDILSPHVHKYDNFDYLAKQIIKTDKGCFINGSAGTGKTYLVNKIKELLKNKNVVSLAPTNKAARLINGETIHFWLSNHKSVIRSYIKDVEYIFIDEVSMLIESFYHLFATLKTFNPKLKIFLIGDHRQLKPVCDRVEDADYVNSPILFDIVDGNKLVLTKCRRSDDKLFNVSKNIDKIDVHKFGNEKQYLNICYYNRTRHMVNKACMDRFVNRPIMKKNNIKTYKIENELYDRFICKDMPIIATVNSKANDVYNNEMYYIKALPNKIKNNNKIVITDHKRDISIEPNEFNNIFDLAFCITSHKSQGSTFNEPYMIYDWDHMNESAKYVAITRATKLENIHFNF